MDFIFLKKPSKYEKSDKIRETNITKSQQKIRNVPKHVRDIIRWVG